MSDGWKFNCGHDVDYGEQYFRNMLTIIESIRKTERSKFDSITGRMSEALMKKGNVWMHAQAGHMGYVEFIESNRGNPGILRSSSNWGGSGYDEMKPGDVLMTNYVNEKVKQVKDMGVYVVGVPVNYVDNEWAPRGFASPNVNNWLLGDVSDIIFHSYIPYHQGIVTSPMIPEMKLFPSAANSLCTIYWMFQAEVANRFKNKKYKALEMGGKVMDTVLSRINNAYETQKDRIWETAAIVAKKIGGGSHYHTTSMHRGVQDESNGVAMGPMMTNAYKKWAPSTPYQYIQAEKDVSDMKKGDVHLFASIEPDDPKIVEDIKAYHDMGMYTIYIGPANSHETLKHADVFIDNQSPEGGGLLDINGYDEKVATVSSVMNNWLAWIFTAQMVNEMIFRGWVPWFWMGFYQVGGKPYDDGIRQFFIQQQY